MKNNNKQGRNGKLSNPYLKYTKTDIDVIKNSFTKSEFKQISEMFIYFDRQGSKQIKREGIKIDRLDLSYALRAMGYLITTIELRELAMFLDPKRTQLINFEQFLTGCYFVRDRKPDKNEIIQSLLVFDPKKSGYVNVSDIRNIVTQIGDMVNNQEFETVFSEIEINNGKCAIADLVELLTIN